MKAIKHLRAAILHNDKLWDKELCSEAFLLNKGSKPKHNDSGSKYKGSGIFSIISLWFTNTLIILLYDI